MTQYIRWFREIRLGDVPLVGGKTASLGEMYGELGAAGVRVPNGFAITAEAYRAILDADGLRSRIAAELTGVTGEDVEVLAAAGARLRGLVENATLPRGLAEEIAAAYGELAAEYGAEPAVAVRSSATAEDLPQASFAGQHESYLGVRGVTALLAACRRCFASIFTDRAIVYRIQNGFDHLSVLLSIAVQKMVASDRASSGVVFTLDPDSGFRDVVLINGAFGLGEAVVQGQLDPDEFLIFKPTLRTGHDALLRRKIARKTWRLVAGAGGQAERVEVAPGEQRSASLVDAEALALARLAVSIEAHYSRKADRPTPMDIEWAKDADDGRLYILQARPETVHRAERRATLEVFSLEPGNTRERLVSGVAIGQRIGVGPTRVLRDPGDLRAFQAGDVLVASMTDPDWEPIMKRAAAIVTDRGGRTCHAAIVSRELGVPCVVGTGNATGVLAHGQVVTVSCAEGETGIVYRGALPFARRKVDLIALPRPAIKVMLNVGNPGEAFRLAALPSDGVGLARIEFIIGSFVRAHPLALLFPDRVQDPDVRAEIEALTHGYADGGEYFAERLAEGVAIIAAAFYPKEVIVRLSDFKSNEYAGLIGGRDFEPVEGNPMLGFRGAFRYTHPRYRDAFALECRALHRVRERMGLTNVKLMVPFCRTPREGQGVLDLLATNGLVRGVNGLEVYVMAEIPANAILADEFAALFDGFSIGSNDLTQLVLGVDRDSELVAPEFDERNPAVLSAIGAIIDGARRAGRRVGICGQAPSDYPEMVSFLVRRGISSISLNPDALVRGVEAVAAAEAGAETAAGATATSR
ncbi:MAG TPA: phosphoenolpyruvate synthase [Candidatus Methylomirabilis sp.]|nr:phosphoenolpyruvate synthase [Candidatus Methylomirabilis sp.]